MVGCMGGLCVLCRDVSGSDDNFGFCPLIIPDCCRLFDLALDFCFLLTFVLAAWRLYPLSRIGAEVYHSMYDTIVS